jgi:hypothetical protein
MISGRSIFLPRNSGVRPPINPATKTAMIPKTSELRNPTPLPPNTHCNIIPDISGTLPSGVWLSCIVFTLPVVKPVVKVVVMTERRGCSP